ncbi:hypothetical protein D3226_07895 [Leucobacter chromiireducens subsp. chromiireducens]|uniref:FxLD family lantipeptide n=2 Tax=Leucobacter TaxID=55968 RepID=A0ABS1SNY1_9MICO|nr:hypothetical protein [Leucobacter chromiireducens subsp. chromiireducens]
MMTETTKTTPAETAAETAAQTNPAAGLESAASFADAETREILNLLGDSEAGGSCCGGSCCI